MPITIAGGITYSGGIAINSWTPLPSATANTTTITAVQNTAITSFYPFSAVTGGTGTYTYFVQSGTLPPGITLDSSTGQVSGTPTATQSTASVVFAVKDSNNQVASTTSSVSFTVTDPLYTVQYLVVAGGGGGASCRGSCFSSGGGGAGGMITGCTIFTAGTTYTITVGAGGSAGCGAFSPGFIGANTRILGSGITTVTARGGGAGDVTGGGKPGGSGGGGTGKGGGSNRAGGTGTPGQGNPGGSGYNIPGVNIGGAGGGGGGAGTAGSDGSMPGTGPTGIGGAGGCGAVWPYTGNYYAGGGGGGARATGGSGGAGGGGNGRSIGPTNVGTPGTANTGGGGGGGAYGSGFGFPGGSGVVILAVPTPLYPGSYNSIASTPANAPGMTVLTFTSSGTYTA